ncbi:glycosyltransferase family 2 protein [Hyphococcus sp.]|jgi:glycosyltransferase involved in cell wall biosynthesis|uniref:glycosyltransferase family 2 protein n=1 Tax=Hyphococcus sp. TaxID=2038636 RepID=UPI003D0F98A7
MKLSLVISTLGRTSDLNNLFESLAAQTFDDFEVIVVDQNDDDRLAAFIRPDWGFPLRRIHTPRQRGLSRGRNAGWRQAQGDAVLFPDDDCWYPADFLSTGMRLLEELGADIVTGRAADMNGRSINGRFEKTRQQITRKNVFTTQIEWVAFFRRDILHAVGGYDEDIGVGASTPFQACEGQDIVLRALPCGAKAFYDPDLFGHHADITKARPDRASIKKARGYARGLGRVLRLHEYSTTSLMMWLARPLAKMPFNMVCGRFKKTVELGNIFLGRVEGYWAPVTLTKSAAE